MAFSLLPREDQYFALFSQMSAKLQQADEIHAAMDLLEHAKGMGPHLLEIQRLENEADDIYFRSMADLFKNSPDAIHLIKWKELYEILENATDRCESVGNIIESIVLKHN